MDIPEIDPNFEPQIRARSNTWPVRPKDLAEEEAARTPSSNEGDRDTTVDIKQEKPSSEYNIAAAAAAKKAGGSRRNAWGNLSYADLITKAIQSSPDCRLTLSQIYDWMVQNVPYFRDKGDSNSSAGWKNSIRHNLSLHSRFMRIQNEGTGKSSWWVINPDAKAGKTPRRRATSMDTKTYEKKRGRVKKKVEALRAAMAGDNLSETGSYGGSAQDLNIHDQFSLSPQDFRQRTSSNASSMGRLSPIQSLLEPDLHDNQVPPMSPVPWNHSLNSSPRYDTYGNSASAADQSLSESLADMFVGDAAGGDVQDPMITSSNPSSAMQSQSQLSPNYQSQANYLPPPPYSEPLRRSPQPPSAAAAMQQRGYVPQTLTELLNAEGGGGNFSQDSFLSQVEQVMASPPQGSTLGQYGFQRPQPQLRGPMNSSLLRQALTTHCPINIKHAQRPNNGQFMRAGGPPYQEGLQSQLLAGGTMHTNMQQQQQQQHHHQQQQQQLQQRQQLGESTECSGLPTDLDMADFTTDFGGACDVDQILKHELTFDDNLDFNFDASSMNQNSSGGMRDVNTNAAAAAAAAAIASGKFDNIVQT